MVNLEHSCLCVRPATPSISSSFLSSREVPASTRRRDTPGRGHSDKVRVTRHDSRWRSSALLGFADHHYADACDRWRPLAQNVLMTDTSYDTTHPTTITTCLCSYV